MSDARALARIYSGAVDDNDDAAALATWGLTGAITLGALSAITGLIDEADCLGSGVTELEHAELAAIEKEIGDTTVTVYTVGVNDAGYLPESDPAAYLDRSDAIAGWKRLLLELPDAYAPDDDCICSDSGDTCLYHDIKDHVACIAGEVDASPDMQPSAVVDVDRVLPVVVWLHSNNMRYRDACEQYGTEDIW